MARTSKRPTAPAALWNKTFPGRQAPTIPTPLGGPKTTEVLPGTGLVGGIAPAKIGDPPLTIRDWLAMHFMVAQTTTEDGGTGGGQWEAFLAYVWADAMVEERAGRTPEDLEEPRSNGRHGRHTNG